MALTFGGDMAKLKALAKQLDAMGRPGSALYRAMQREMADAVKALTRSQFAFGVGPDGKPQTPRKRDGKPGLESAKLSRGAIAIEVTEHGILAYAKNSKLDGMLEGHQDGHVFAARTGNVRQYRGAATTGSTGKLITKRAFIRAAREASAHSRMSGNMANTFYTKETARGRAIVADLFSIRGVQFGQRILPPRPIHPTGSNLTARWERRIGEGVDRVIHESLDPLR